MVDMLNSKNIEAFMQSSYAYCQLHEAESREYIKNSREIRCRENTASMIAFFH